MEDKIFKRLAWAGRIGLPALSVFYGTIGKIWTLPYTEQIPLTITAVAVLINAWLSVDSKAYWNDHDIVEVQSNESDGI